MLGARRTFEQGCILSHCFFPQADMSPKKPKAIPGQPPQSQGPAPGLRSVPSLGTRPPIDPSAHHFCFSIDLRSISNLDVTSPVNCFLR